MSGEKVSQPVQFDEFITNAPAFFDEIASGRRVTVERSGQLVRLSPVRRRGGHRRQHFSMNDPLWEIAGIGHSEGPTDVSSNKHKYLADAATDLHQPDKS